MERNSESEENLNLKEPIVGRNIFDTIKNKVNIQAHQAVDALTSPESEVIQGVSTVVNTGFWLPAYMAARETIFEDDLVLHESMDKVATLYFAGRILVGSAMAVHGANRLRDNGTYYRVALNMMLEDVSEFGQKLRKQ